MNSVQLVGRLTADPEVRMTGTNQDIPFASFTLAVDREYANRNDPNAQTADFIRCVAGGKTADFVGKYFAKGNRIGLNGRIQTGSYTNKDGQKVYTTDVRVDKVEFVESKKASGETAQKVATQKPNPDRSFMDVPDDAGDELPFN